MNFALTAVGDAAALAAIRIGTEINQKAEGRE
jgi:hypothetical protein